MACFLNAQRVFGPVHSRRLGHSLGVNLSPCDGKRCTFDCLYCENGLNADTRTTTPWPRVAEVEEALSARLRELAAAGDPVDVITLAGNGEPTANPDFPAIVDVVVRLRDELYPSAKVAVLSNATMCARPDVHAALLRVDDNILKLDTADQAFIELLDRPCGPYDVERTIEALASFEGHAIVQTIFVRGSVDGVSCDNTGEKYVGPWLDAIRRIRPSGVTVYTIARDTPVDGLEKAPREVLDAIRDRVRALGIDCSASY